MFLEIYYSSNTIQWRSWLNLSVLAYNFCPCWCPFNGTILMFHDYFLAHWLIFLLSAIALSPTAFNGVNFLLIWTFFIHPENPTDIPDRLAFEFESPSWSPSQSKSAWKHQKWFLTKFVPEGKTFYLGIIVSLRSCGVLQFSNIKFVFGGAENPEKHFKCWLQP